MRVRDLVDMPDLHLVPLVDDGLDQPIRWIYTTDLLDPGRYLSGGELVLTGMMWRRTPADSSAFVAATAAHRIACLAAGDAAYGEVPRDLVAACREYGVPLLEVPVEVSFATITERVIRQLTAERQGDLATQLGHRRRLLAAVAEGVGLDVLLELWSGDAEMTCWLLTATGRCPVQTAPGLDESRADRLAVEFLGARSFPHVVRVGGRAEAVTYSLFPVGGQPQPRIAGWFLACEGDYREWPRVLHEAVTELVSLIGLERGRLEEASRAERVFVEQLLRLVLTGRSNPDEVADRFAVTGLADRPYVAVSAAVSPEPDGEIAYRVLDELLATVAPEPDCPARVAAVDDEALAVVAVDGGSFADALRTRARLLDPALSDRRLLVGVGLRTVGAAGLPAALNEARQARRLAEPRPGRVAVLTADEVDSHALLLATVPDDLRQTYRTRMLGAVLEYDARHHSDLVPTLEAFLESSCSWTHCAERLHLHVNTLRYRIQRIEDLTGRSLSKLEDRVDFFLAFRA